MFYILARKAIGDIGDLGKKYARYASISIQARVPVNLVTSYPYPIQNETKRGGCHPLILEL